MNFFRFEDPWLLLTLALVPFMFWQERKIVTAIHYSSINTLKAVSSHRSKVIAAIPIILRFTAITLIIIAFARPQEGRKRNEIIEIFSIIA